MANLPSYPVFDYTAGRPHLVSDRIHSAMEDAKDAPGSESVKTAYEVTFLDELASNPEYRSAYRDIFEQAGVNLNSITVSYRDGPGVFTFSRVQSIVDRVDWLHKVVSPDHARRVADMGAVGYVINTQSLGNQIGADLSEVDTLYNVGYRIFQLTYNDQNYIATGCQEPNDGGLTRFGRDVVDRLNELGGVIDLSHCSRRTALDTIDRSSRPVAFTHSACKSLAEPAFRRTKSDEELKALAEGDGYLGLVAVPLFLAPDANNPTVHDPDAGIDAFFDHLEHAISILGIDRVGLGTDFSNTDANAPELYIEEHKRAAAMRGAPEGHGSYYRQGLGEFGTYADFPVIREGLDERFSEPEVRKILGENFLSFWERVVE